MTDHSPVYADDQKAPVKKALRLGAISLVVIAAISLTIWGLVAGLPGVYGALIGVLIGGVALSLTAASVLATANTTPATTGAVVLGGWLLKIVILLIVLAVLKDMTFYHRIALVVTTVLSVMVMLAADVVGITRSKTTYIGS